MTALVLPPFRVISLAWENYSISMRVPGPLARLPPPDATPAVPSSATLRSRAAPGSVLSRNSTRQTSTATSPTTAARSLDPKTDATRLRQGLQSRTPRRGSESPSPVRRFSHCMAPSSSAVALHWQEPVAGLRRRHSRAAERPSAARRGG